MKIAPCALLAALLISAGIASAQQATQPARTPAPTANQQKLTPVQQAMVAKQDAEMTRAAAAVIQLVDQSKATEIWDGASSVAKAVVQKHEFVAQIAADRKQLGAPTERKQVAVTRASYAEGRQVPAGNYINVIHATKFANVATPVRELVSFRLDSDKIWRVSGYSVR